MVYSSLDLELVCQEVTTKQLCSLYLNTQMTINSLPLKAVYSTLEQFCCLDSFYVKLKLHSLTLPRVVLIPCLEAHETVVITLSRTTSNPDSWPVSFNSVNFGRLHALLSLNVAHVTRFQFTALLQWLPSSCLH